MGHEHEAYGNPGERDGDVATIRAIYDAFARNDVEAALAHVAADIEWFPTGTASRVGRTEPYRGHEGVREYFADAARVWDDLTLHADDIRAAATSVVVFGHVEGRAGGELLRRSVVWTWRLHGGKAVSLRVHDVGEAPEA